MEQKFDNYVLRYTDFILRWRWVVIILTLFLVGFSFSGAPNLSFSSNYRIFFSEKNPELIAFESFQNTYTKNDNIMYVLQPADKDLTKAYVAAAIEDITKQAWQIPYAIRVDSVTNFQHSYAQGDDLIVDDFIYDSPSLSPDMLKKKWKMATNEPLLYGNLLALDSEATGINVTLQYPEKEISEIPTAVKKARSIAEDIRKKYPDIHIAITGVSMMNNAFMEAALKDATTLTPLMYLILIIVMLFVLRSITKYFLLYFHILKAHFLNVLWLTRIQSME